MTKSELIARAATGSRYDQKEVSDIFERLVKSMRESMCEGNSIFIRGFGTFQLKLRKEKPGRIITKKKQIIIPAHYTAKFVPAPKFKKQLKKLPVK